MNVKPFCLSATVCLVFLLSSCGAGEPYFKNELNFRKVSESCTGASNIEVVANTNGERYTFRQCATEETINKSRVERKGDTIEVVFDKSGKLATYDVTLDINTYPAYHTIIIDGQPISVAVKN